MAFDWPQFGGYVAGGLLAGAFAYVVTRWGKLSIGNTYDPEILAIFAWRIALGVFAVCVVLNLLFQFRVFT